MLRCQRVFIGPNTIELSTVDIAGVPQTPTTVTATATADDNTVVTITAPVIDAGGLGRHQATLTAARPTIVTVRWVVDGSWTFDDTVHVHGRPVITPDELKEVEPSLASADGFALAKAIEEAEVEAERCTGVSWSRRYSLFETHVHPDPMLHYGHGTVIDTGIYGIVRIGKAQLGFEGLYADPLQTPQTIYAQPIPHSSLVRVSGTGLVQLGVEHGHLDPPMDIRSAIAMRARVHYQRPKSALPSYTDRVGVVDGIAVARLLPTMYTTGVAEVDAIYAAHRVRPVI